jgi:hypothetical protein
MSVLRGIFLVGRFRRDGLAEFEGSRNAFLASLAPLIAFPLVGAAMVAGLGMIVEAATSFLASLVGLLTPLLISEVFARRWGVGERWLRFATASNWSQCIVPVVFGAMWVAAWMLVQIGVLPPDDSVVMGILLVVLVYALAVQWFVLRHGLGLSRGRATLLMLGSGLVTGALVMAPQMLSALTSPAAPAP